MLTALRSRSNLRPFSVNLDWTWSGSGDRPALVLLRRTRTHPQYSTSLIRQDDLVIDGLEVLDVEASLGVSNRWSKTQREVFLGRNDRVESNLQLGEFNQYFSALLAPSSENFPPPSKILVSLFDEGSNSVITVELSDITLVNYSQPNSLEWSNIKQWEIFHAPGGGATVRAGIVRASSEHNDGVTPAQFSWQPEGLASISVNYDHSSQQITEVALDEEINPDTGDWTRKFYLIDQSLEPEEVYYYRLYLKQGSDFYITKYHWSTQSVASANYNFAGQLYQQLPAVHQYYDEPEPAKQGKGQLRKYLSLAGANLDHTRSLIEVLRDRHDVNRVYSKALPSLAKMIGWQPDVTSDSILLRKDIADAPDIYQTVGTVTNLRSVVNRVTGWDCRIKEFVHNVFLTNSAENIYLWEIWTQQHDGVSWSSASSLTTTDGMDAHPLAVTDSTNISWLFWHSDRFGGRGLWRQQLGISNAVPKELVLRVPEERISQDITEYPTVLADGDRLWLFWASNRNGVWNIWASWSRSAEPFSLGPDSSETNQINPINLSDHRTDDRHPISISDSIGNIWVFWQSNRRGPTDLWSRNYDGSSWSLSERISSAEFRHLSPTVVVDIDDQIWLIYSNDQGDRINLNAMLYIAGNWSEPFEITSGHHRDEAPTAVLWNGQIRLFWQSNRNSKWQLLGQSLTWSGSEPNLIGSVEVITEEVTEDKEPYVMVDSSTNQLHLFWRSQRRGPEYKSRSIDASDPKMIAELRTYNDHAHYTYDTATNNDDFYARNSVGVFLEPNPERPDLDDRNRRLFKGPLKEFIPINIRPVLFILPEVHREYVYTYDFPEIEPQRLIGEDFSRVTTIVSDEFYAGLSDTYADTIDDWTWIRTWSETTLDHLTVDVTTSLPIDIHFRTWHVGVSEGD